MEGNQTIREALVKIRRELDSYCNGCTLPNRMTEDPPDYTCLRDSLLEIERIVDAALAEPCTNFSNYPDAESARQAWLSDKDNWDEFGSPRLDLHEWLYVPAGDRKEKSMEASNKYREALVAIQALTASHAHELSELGTIYRTAKAFLIHDLSERRS